MTKKELLDAIHGQMIISCQAVKGEPLYVEEKSIMYLMARAAKQAGTPAIRTSSIRDVIAIKEETGLPVIGLVKIQYPGYEGYITPTMKEVDDLVAAGSDVVALDCTLRKRGDGTTVNEFIAQIKEKYPDIILMADISNYEEGVNAWKCGVDIVGTTMSGYTDYTDRCMGDRGRRSNHTSSGNCTALPECDQRKQINRIKNNENSPRIWISDKTEGERITENKTSKGM